MFGGFVMSVRDKEQIGSAGMPFALFARKNSSGDYGMFKQALDKSFAVIEFTPNGQILTANNNFLSAVGYNLAEITGKHHKIFVAVSDRDSAVYKDFWAKLSAGQSLSGRYCRIKKDGQALWLEASYMPLLNKAGKVVKVIKIATDITSKMMEQMDHDGQLEALDRSQAIIHFTPTGQIVSANENFLQATGYALDEIVGQHHAIFMPASDKQSLDYKVFWQDLSDGKFKSGTFLRVKKTGEDLYLQASYNPIYSPDGKVIKVVKTAIDVTLETLENADYRGQLDAINRSQAIIHFELDGTIIDANDAFLGAMGYQRDEIVGKHHSMFASREDSQSAGYKEFWTTLRDGQHQTGEFRRIGKGGRNVYIQASYNPVLDPQGNPFKVVKFATDITDVVERRNKREEVSRQIDKQLQSIVQQAQEVTDQAEVARQEGGSTSGTVQNVASAAEELTASIKEIAGNAAGSQIAVDAAANECEATEEATKALTSTSEAMGNIVNLINDIAGQINLLALNATIESARAGDAGKGFAVVAGEVKNLAAQVGKATEQISQEITTLQSVSGDVVQRIDVIRSSVNDVSMQINSVAGAVEQQESSTREISSSIQRAAEAMQTMDMSLQAISGAADGTTGAADKGLELYRSL